MSLRRRSSLTISMKRSLARSNSVSLVLPLAAPQPKSAILCALRRVQSDIPAVEYSVIISDLANNSQNNSNNISEGYHQQLVESVLGGNNGDGGEADSNFSDYTSCSSSIADVFDVMEEPRRVSKEILRSVSLSFQWLNLPFHEFDLPRCIEHTADFTGSLQVGTANTRDGMSAASTGGGVVSVGREGSDLRFLHIHECRTGRSLVSHVELRTAMDSLRYWTMQVPRNCCLSYRHDISGELATLPWPDLEAGGLEEIEDFVSTVNRVEGTPVFSPRYER